MIDRARKKRGERSEALQAALKMGLSWELQPEDREEPDFMVTHQGVTFGLEVTSCHIGLVGRERSKKGGSSRVQKEVYNQRWLGQIVSAFEREKSVMLKLDYVGPANKEGEAAIRAFLEREKFEIRDMFSRGCWCVENLMVQAYRSKYSSHVFINDRVGWVHESGDPLQAAIDKKMVHLAKYRETCADMRLLVVADRTANSGKLILPEAFKPNLRGFNAVYFFSYPESVTAFEAPP